MVRVLFRSAMSSWLWQEAERLNEKRLCGVVIVGTAAGGTFEGKL